MIRFLRMVQAGPQAVAAAVTEVLGAPDRLRLFTELDAEAHARSRLELLKKLMLRAGAGAAVEALEARGAFRPMTTEECAR